MTAATGRLRSVQQRQLHSSNLYSSDGERNNGSGGGVVLSIVISFHLIAFVLAVGAERRRSTGFEAYIGVLLLKTVAMGYVSEWQVVTCGVLLIVMAVGNFINTVETLVTKFRVKAKMKNSKRKNDLNPESVAKAL